MLVTLQLDVKEAHHTLASFTLEVHDCSKF